MPGHLNAAENAFRVRHHDGEAAILGGHRRQAIRRTVRVVRVDLGRLALVIDITQRRQALGLIGRIIENGTPCAVETLRPGEAVTLRGARAAAECRVEAVHTLEQKTGE